MSILIVVNQPTDWSLHIPGIQLVLARDYLTDPKYSEQRGLKVFNLCRSYRYQSTGYYVSLLASARGHKPLPSISTIQDMKSQTIVRFVSDDLQELIQAGLTPIKSREFTLSIYFGANLARRYDRICSHLFKLFPAPFLRAKFVYNEGEQSWQLQNIRPIAASEIPADHHDFVVEMANDYFAGRRSGPARKAPSRYSLAILVDPAEEEPPSDEKAVQRFVKAAEAIGFDVELIEKDDYGRLAEFDALFIRETTSVNHHTFRFARRATAEGLVVMDDPVSILRCTNKVYLAELLARRRIATPRTLIVHRDNIDQVQPQLGLPCILKAPDGWFSKGVKKVDDSTSLRDEVDRMLDRSDLIIAQEYLPTDFDWRIGVFDRRPIFACKYYMARGHWQIIKRGANNESDYGRVETLPVQMAPQTVVRTALRAANLIGDGFYGVDLKQVGRKVFVIEVNDCPNVDAGNEDAFLKDDLYYQIMSVFMRRIEHQKGALYRS
jgi:glutathione synthase/RimK-type ligase-like ATP-grasp enzyme